MNLRGPDSLFELVATLQLPAEGVVVRVGCGEGHEALELAKRFGLRVHGVDPAQRNLDVASALVSGAGLSDLVDFQRGYAEALPISDASTDLVWCKEVLLFTDLRQALRFVRARTPTFRNWSGVSGAHPAARD